MFKAVAFVLAIYGSTVLAAPANLPASVADALKTARLPDSALSLFVQPVDENNPSLAFRAEMPVNPASTMKLLTTYAALEILGPAYQWQTQVISAGHLEQDVWQGDIYIKAQGDPKFTQEQLWLLLRQLRQRGIREINGELKLDRSYFPVGNEDDGVFDGSADRPYNVSPDPLVINFKTLRVQLTPTEDRVTLLADPQLPDVMLVNQLKTMESGSCADWKSQVSVLLQDKGKQKTLTFTGKFPKACPSANYYAAIGTHPMFAAASIRDTWRELGGLWPKLDNQLKQENWPIAISPENGSVLASQNSAGLSNVIQDVNKYSNNLMARMVFLALGRKAGFNTNPLAASIEAIRVWLSGQKLSFPELVLENGAGLSRVERISTAHLGQLLLQAWRSPYMPEFMASLPIAGVDGTVKKRFANDELASYAHLKTGTLNDVRALAGYVRTRSGHWVVIAAIINHKAAERGGLVLDEVVKSVYDTM
ncbi:D-alanyl-D-alanine carboxypeptidase/D-alanyl-D-alanine endopeptidase [Leeia oryzae]|uniref:D-alanyl-D-alanine carboxypeptidase/D-alanyl-D-alanine endopeptidase n=1 Tax=Leeia oryzae TaxID=356662 RepID=UPI000378E939|nr:D-alanyl-D-alanine carboxypeptidase/D-alanyl-D-alanine-endopeptidase [Leeia oryzae]